MYKKRKRNLYNPSSSAPFAISRSRIDSFLECPRCFYLDRRLGLGRPSMPGWTLNSAVDALLKNEFDILRKKGHAHDLMKEYGIDAVPFDHPDLPIWRDDVHRYEGACVLHTPTNLKVCGIIDDVWQNNEGQLIIVDYKATSTSQEISLEDKYKQGYKKQMEIYQWIFIGLGFEVSDIGYFVFANAGRNRPAFDGRLEFELSIVEHKGDREWVEPTLIAIKRCLDLDRIPESSKVCEYCAYRKSMPDRFDQRGPDS